MCHALLAHTNTFLRARQQVPNTLYHASRCVLHVNAHFATSEKKNHLFDRIMINISAAAGVTIQAPQLDINTVAAGGGSRLFYRTGVFQVSCLTS